MRRADSVQDSLSLRGLCNGTGEELTLYSEKEEMEKYIRISFASNFDLRGLLSTGSSSQNQVSLIMTKVKISTEWHLILNIFLVPKNKRFLILDVHKSE